VVASQHLRSRGGRRGLRRGAGGARPRLDRVLASLDTDPVDAAEQLYGPDAISEHVDLETGEIVPAGTPDVTEPATESGDASQQAETAAPLAAVPAPGDDDEEEPGPKQTVDEIAAAKAAGVAAMVISSGAYKGSTIGAVHDIGEEGSAWFSYVLRHPGKYDAALVAAVDTFVKGTPQAEAA